MTATGTRVHPSPPTARRPSPRAAWRLVYLELRRNPWPWVVPLVAALFVFDPYRTATGYPPIWDLRASVIPNKLLPDFVAFAGGVSAWLGSRDARRKTADMVAATTRSGWARRSITLAAMIGWVLAVYLVFVAVLYVVTSQQATWGGPPWWPVAVAAAALAAVCAVGFTAGVFFPGRFVAPLAALGAFFVSLVSFQQAVGKTGGYSLLSPSASVPNTDVGVFYHYLPDLPIAQVMFLTGVIAIAVGALARPAAAESGQRLTRVAVVVIAIGLAASGTAIGLTGTARQTPNGVVIPALHDAANDRPIPYTPVCSHAAVPVCLHPAFQAALHDVTVALTPVLSEVAGLPGAPARVAEVPTNGLYGSTGVAIRGTPPVFGLPIDFVPGSFGITDASFNTQLRALLVTAFIAGSGGPMPIVGAPAQKAVELALLEVAGVRLNAQGQPEVSQGRSHGPPPGPAAAKLAQISAAASRFAALPAAARHAWLATHLAALRAGQMTLAQLP